MTISDLLPLSGVGKWERCYPGSEWHLQDFRTGQNCFLLPVFTVGALAVPKDSSGLHVLARGLLQGGVLTNCGFGTNVRISCSVSTRSGAKALAEFPASYKHPPHVPMTASVSALTDLSSMFSRTLLGKFVEFLLFRVG